MAETFETTFVCFENDPRSPDGHVADDEIARLLPAIEIVTVAGLGPGKRLAQAKSLLRRDSWEYGRYRIAEMKDRLERLAEQKRPHVIHFDDLGVAQFGPLPGALNVYSAHNVEYGVLEGTISSSRGLRRQFARIERGKVEQLERRVWQTMSLSLACSDLDAGELRAGGARVVVCPNGTDAVAPLRAPRREQGQPLQLLFVGAVDYRPNQLGLEWFIAEVLPRVRDQLPVIVDVVGGAARKLAGADAVVLHGRVPFLQPFYERAHAVIAPVLYGSGTRLKVIEAMAYRRPVVATTAGAEGLPIHPGVEYFQADDPETFAAALLELARQSAEADERLEQMLDAARRSTEPLLWPRIVRELARTYLSESAVAG